MLKLEPILYKTFIFHIIALNFLTIATNLTHSQILSSHTTIYIYKIRKQKKKKLSCVKYESIPRISSRQICPKMMQGKLNLHRKLAMNRTRRSLCPFCSPLFNYNIMVHWSELNLKRPVSEIR